MAAPKVEDISSIRAYVFDYVCGIIWLLGFAAIWLTPARVVSLNATALTLATAYKGVYVPELVQGFLLAIAGVAVPYAVSTILRPLSLRVMTISLETQRRFHSWKRRKAPTNTSTPSPRSIGSIALDAIRTTLGLHDGIRITREMQHVFLQGRHTSISAAASRWQEDLFFRASVVVPSSMLIAAIVFHYSPFLQSFAAAATFAAVFVLGSWFVNREFDSYMDCLHMSTVLASKYPSPKSEEDSIPKKSTHQPFKAADRR
jgi:hypothetical protein